MNKKDTNPKDAIGSLKPALSTVPCPVLYELGAAMTEGCKYGRHNYRVIGVRASVYYDAAQRHIMAWWEGQDLDPESGLPHLAKAMACLCILRDADIRDKLNDDRPPATDPKWIEQSRRNTAQVLEKIAGIVQEPYTQLRLQQETSS